MAASAKSPGAITSLVDTMEQRHLAGQGYAQSWQNPPKRRKVPQRERCPAQSCPGSPPCATHLPLLPAAFSPGTDGATSAPARPHLRCTPPALPLPASAPEICQRSEDQSPPMHAGAACLRTRIATKGTATLRSAPLNPVPSTVASSPSWSTSYIPAQASWHTVAVWIQPEPPARPPGQPRSRCPARCPLTPALLIPPGLFFVPAGDLPFHYLSALGAKVITQKLLRAVKRNGF